MLSREVTSEARHRNSTPGRDDRSLLYTAHKKKLLLPTSHKHKYNQTKRSSADHRTASDGSSVLRSAGVGRRQQKGDSYNSGTRVSGSGLFCSVSIVSGERRAKRGRRAAYSRVKNWTLLLPPFQQQQNTRLTLWQVKIQRVRWRDRTRIVQSRT